MKNRVVYGPFRRILFCTDFSENADFAFEFAVEQARRLEGCALYLLHVVPEPEAQFWRTYLNEVDDVESKGREDMERKIQESYRARLPAGVGMQVEVRTGTDYDQILEFAEEQKIDLLIMGRQGRSSLGKVLFGNVTEKVVRKARCPVLVIPLCFERGEGEG
ncbi:MAG: universal stress protein [Kiritimatiellae bacterium]|nr:universal stress protein [Kiritimatiellia bacterium]